MNIIDLQEEIEKILLDVSTHEDGGRIWEPYQKVAGYIIRLQEIHNYLAWKEVTGEATPVEKKFRTMIVDKTIESLEKVASYESRKITAKRMEWDIEKGV